MYIFSRIGIFYLNRDLRAFFLFLKKLVPYFPRIGVCMKNIPSQWDSKGVSPFGGCRAASCKKSRAVKALLFVLFVFFLLIDHAGEDLDDLNDRDDGDGKAHSDAVFHEIEVSKTECLAKEGNLNNECGHDEGKETCAPEPLVLTLHGEDRAVERTHIERVEDLTHGKREERHGGAELSCIVLAQSNRICMVCFREEVCTDEIGDQCDDGHEKTLIENGKAETACEDAFLGVAGLAVHDVSFGLFHAECQRREAVCNEIDPKELNRLEDGEADEGREEDGKNLGEIGSEEELDRFADVICLRRQRKRWSQSYRLPGSYPQRSW